MSLRVKLCLSGFTLVEVVAALGAFSIAFLAGFAAIGSLMIRQDINYRATVAGSMACILLKDSSDWSRAKKNATLLGNYYLTEPNNGMVMSCSFRGYPVSVGGTPILIPAKDTNTDVKIYYLKDKADLTGYGINLEEYRPILVTDLQEINVANPKALAFWYGAREEVAADRPATLDFLGVYTYE